MSKQAGTLSHLLVVLGISAGIALLAGCENRKAPPTAPSMPAAPTLPAPAPPLELRDDAASYGRLDRVDLLSARISGRVLEIDVAYGGGCTTHTLTAVGGKRFLASYPPQLEVFVRHDAAGDLCDAYIFKTLRYDVTPAVQEYESANGKSGLFYLRIIAPGSVYDSRLVPVQ